MTTTSQKFPAVAPLEGEKVLFYLPLFILFTLFAGVNFEMGLTRGDAGGNIKQHKFFQCLS